MSRKAKAPSWMQTRPAFGRFLLALITAAALAALMVDWSPLGGARGLEVGAIALNDYRASQGLEVVDQALTEEKREQAHESVPPTFNYDVLLARAVQSRVDSAFTDIRAFLEESAAKAPAPLPAGDDSDPTEGTDEPPASLGPDPAALAERLAAFKSTLRVDISDVDLATLQVVDFAPAVQRDIVELVRVAMADYVVLDRGDLPPTPPIRVVRVEGNAQQDLLVEDFSRVRDLIQARRFVGAIAESDFGDRPAHVRAATVAVAQMAIEANLRFDASATAVQRDEAAQAVQPITTTYAKGQTIVRSGDRVTAWTQTVLAQMYAEALSYKPWLHCLALTLVLLAFFVLLESFAKRFISKFRRDLKDLATLGVMLLLVAGATALLNGVGQALFEVIPRIPKDAWGFAAPIAAGAILVRTLMNSETAMVWVLAAATVCAAILGADVWMGLYLLLVALAGAGGVGHNSERGRLVRAGTVAAITAAGLAVALDLAAATGIDATDALDPNALMWHVLFGLGGGLVSGVLAVGLVPLFEQLGFLTPSKLMELANLNHPLMREMIVKAPGTYHHSMVVGSLAEAAAEAVHANSLLVRVGAYFHDVGKMLKPIYFIENQRDAENPHDRLTPSMSGLVIISHVKEGIELAREHGLPEPLIDMIPQHHGTSKVGFFYNKAVQQADPDKGTPDESDYRYPGPKPQTKEAAIMMLADGVEAATRSLSVHSEGAIRARVGKIVNSVIGDGQLDDCPLTLRDLHTVSETFIRVLLGIHHHRIEYPTAPKPGKKGVARGLPASSITLEVPSQTPNPDAAHPLVRAAEERKRSAGDSVSITGEKSRSALGLSDSTGKNKTVGKDATTHKAKAVSGKDITTGTNAAFRESGTHDKPKPPAGAPSGKAAGKPKLSGPPPSKPTGKPRNKPKLAGPPASKPVSKPKLSGPVASKPAPSAPPAPVDAPDDSEDGETVVLTPDA